MKRKCFREDGVIAVQMLLTGQDCCKITLRLKQGDVVMLIKIVSVEE